MKKNGVKNFIFSFILSLLAVVVVDRIFFNMPDKIPVAEKNNSAIRNISLFSKAENLTLQEQDTLKFSAIENLVSDYKIKSSELPELDTSVKTAKNEPSIVYEPEANIVNIAQDTDNNINIEHNINTDITAASEIKLETDIEELDIQDTVVTDAQIVYADISDTISDENKTENIDQDNSSKIIAMAQNDIIHQDDSFIPLTESAETLHEQIDVLTSSETTQIAMLEPTALVSSIESFDKPEEKNIAEINLKENSSNLHKSADENEDSPWVVAQGNRFAKNKIAQIDTLKDTKTNQDIVIQDGQESREEQAENVITVHKNDNSSDKIPSSVDIKQSETEAESSLNNEQKEAVEVLESEENTQSNLLAPKPLLIPTEDNNTKLAYKMIQNLIIPLPDDIASDADIVPQLSSEPNKNKTKDKNEEIKQQEKESSLFKSISSWFSSNKKDKKEQDGKETKNSKPSKKNTANKKKNGLSLFEISNTDTLETEDNYDEAPEIMPAELKLSFQPNRAEISGHTLRWIHAFADNARDNSDIYIEIRIDGTNSFALQQKRLNLLSSIFANRGVDFRKVNIIFTAREPNSFIIRNIKFNDSKEIINKDDFELNYQHW
ncbi:MAG: hypothetical protein IJ019_01950 [Alphaproteobacteria bacterium]|nr:hypothetical protein [Alphaproteobacteria bacterium]